MPLSLCEGGLGGGGLAVLPVAVRVPAVDPVGRCEEAVGHRPHFRGREGHADTLTTEAEDVGRGPAEGHGVDAEGVGASGDEERGAAITLEGDPGVVAAVGDGAVADGDVALCVAEELRSAGGGEHEVGGAVESGAGHGCIVPERGE